MTLFNEYLTNEEERTYDTLVKLEEQGWRVKSEEPVLSGIMYTLWKNNEERTLYLSEKRLYQGKATIGKLVSAQQLLKLAKARGNDENVKKYQDLIIALEKGLKESTEYTELFGEDYYYAGGVSQLEPAQKYKTLNDAAEATGQTGLKKGSTEIWYMKPEYFRDFNMGWNFLFKHGGELTKKLKFSEIPKKSHILLGKIAERNPGKIFHLMQGEVWSPRGEANNLIQKMGLHHTSMSVGDVIKSGNKVLLVDMSGFKDLTEIVNMQKKWKDRFPGE